MRRQLRGAKASYKVVKNTLAKRALKGTSFAPLEKFFEGTTAIAYTKNDPVLLAKTLTTFIKTAPALSIKAAVVQGRAVQPAEVNELATLPGKPELYAKLLFVLLLVSFAFFGVSDVIRNRSFDQHVACRRNDCSHGDDARR